MTYSFRPLGAAALVAATLAAPAAFAASSDTLVIARSMDVNSLDPARAFCDTCQIYLSATYETLVTLAPDNKSVVPGLALKWEENADLTEFTFHLNPDAVFADGSPVEAGDVVWSLTRVLNLKALPSFLMDGMTGVEAVDAHTVKVTLEAPNSEFINKLSAAYMGVVNSDVAMEAGAVDGPDAPTADKAETWFLSHSAGSGPFVLSNYAPDNELRFARNEKYHGKKPAFASVVITQVQDAVSQAQALESGAVDVAMQIDPDTAKGISSPDVTITQIPSYNFVYFGFVPGAEGMAEVLTPKVREALTYAIDYDGMLEFTVGGAGAKQAAPIPNGFPGTEDLPLRSEDLDKAMTLLKEAGRGDGMKLVAGYPNDNVYGVDLNFMMQKVQQDLERVGVELELKPMTYAVWRDELGAGKLPITAIYYAPDYFGSAQYVGYFGMMPGTSWFRRASHGNEELVANPKEAELYAKALGKTGEANAEAYHALALEMIKDNIIIPMVSPNLVLAHRKDIAGVRYSACCNLPIAEITRK